jgi:hypothetical protein
MALIPVGYANLQNVLRNSPEDLDAMKQFYDNLTYTMFSKHSFKAMYTDDNLRELADNIHDVIKDKKSSAVTKE